MPIIDDTNDNIIVVHEDEIPFFEDFTKKQNIVWSLEDKNNRILPLSKSLVGYINTPDRKIILKPKYQEIGFEHVVRMYLYVYSYKQNDSPSTLDISNIETNIDIPNVFLKHLKKNIQEGLLRTYSVNQRKNSTVKGRVNYTKTIENLYRNKRYFVLSRYSSLSMDNNCNNLIFSALNKLAKIEKYSSAVSQLSVYFKGSKGDIKHGRDTLEKIFFNSNTVRYRQTLIYAAMIIDQLSFGSNGTSSGLESFILNFDNLFENFVAKVLLNVPNGKKFSTWSSSKKIGDIANETGVYDERNYLPDIVYNYVDENSLYNFSSSAFGIIDVKNKAYSQFKNADIYQILTYVQLLHGEKAILVYPAFYNRHSEIFLLNSESALLNEIYACFINIASSSGKEFLVSTECFVEAITKILEDS